MTDIGAMHTLALPEYTKADFLLFLRHLYNGLNPVSTVSAAAALLRLASDFKAEALMVMLEGSKRKSFFVLTTSSADQLIREMTLQQAVSALRMAHECNAEHLRRHAVWLLSTNYQEQSRTQVCLIIPIVPLTYNIAGIQFP